MEQHSNGDEVLQSPRIGWIMEKFKWTNMNDDVACSVDNCICEIVSGREEEHESKNT
jgi:hypothetical protein